MMARASVIDRIVAALATISKVRLPLLLCVFSTGALGQTWTLTTLAGSTSGGGYLDANGTTARFSWPHDVTVDNVGNLYVSDRGNHVVRKVTPAGDVSTLAGLAGVSGSTDANGSTARFFHPAGIVFNSLTGDLIIADSGNHTIRRVTLSGSVSTLAGTAGKFGSTDGDGAAARFTFPQGVAVDQAGFIWVVDTSNHAIRRIVGPNASVTTFAGGCLGTQDGTGRSACFNYPFAIAVDGNGDLWVADSYNYTIRKVTREGVVTTPAGSPSQSGSTDGIGANARFDHPWGITVAPNGDVLVADSSNNEIRKVTAAGVVTTVAGTGSYGTRDGSGTTARFAFPTGIAVDSVGNIYVADRESDAIRKISPSLNVTTMAGSAPAGGVVDGVGTAARLFFPEQPVTDLSGNVYYVDSAHTVRKITPAGVVTTIAGQPGTKGSADGNGSAAFFNFPTGIAIDGSGNLFVADTLNHTIRRVTPSGVVTTVAGTAGVSGKADGLGSQAHFNEPWNLAFDTRGNLLIADSYNHLIRMLDPNGVVTTYAGSSNQGSNDGSTAQASFSYPTGIAVGPDGSVYVADWGNYIIRKITSGVVSTIAGSRSQSGAVDGTGVSARFDHPYSVATDRSSNLFVADDNNQIVRRVTPAGVVTTILGLAGTSGNVDGSGLGARMNYPEGIAVDPQGRVIISDTYNHSIRVASLAPPTIVYFRTSSTAIKPGESVTLSWSTTEATSVSVSPGLGSVATSGSITLAPQQSTTYIMTAAGPGGTVQAQASVTVATAGGKRRAARH
jgi:sugar lactone lactonase YvrE